MVGEDGRLPLPWLGQWLPPLLRHRQGHAVLLHGPSGVGQWELATTLAQAWLCEAASGRLPCGRCASCHLVRSQAHPDLLVLLPEALREPLGWAAGEEGEGAESGSKTKTPSKEIKVDAVRSAVGFAQTTAARGRGKVLLLHPAERMNAIAANALLKTLEEPPGAARFILSSASADQLLPTIRSRCQLVALPLPPPEAALAWLGEQGVAQPEVLLAAAGGQPLDARDWAVLGIDARLWSLLPQRVAAGDAAVFAGWTLPRVIEALQKLAHDALAVAVGGAPRFYPPAAVKVSAPLPAVLAWSRELQRSAAHAEHPVNLALAVEALVVRACAALSGPSRRASVHSAR